MLCVAVSRNFSRRTERDVVEAGRNMSFEGAKFHDVKERIVDWAIISNEKNMAPYFT